MKISIENRHRIVLLLFFLLDHLVWIYGGHLEQAAFFYVVVSECVRMLVLVIVVISFHNNKILSISIKMLMLYCVVMVPLNFYGSYCYTKLMNTVPNVLFFKKEHFIPIEYSLAATLFYTQFMLFIYFFSGKYIDPEILNKK